MDYINGIFILELFAAEYIFSRSFVRRRHFWLRTILCFVGCEIIALFYPVSDREGTYGILNFGLMFVVFLALSILSLKICTKNSIWNLLFAGVAGYAVQHFTFRLESFLALSVLKIPGPFPWYMLPFELIVYVLFYFAFGRKIGKGECPNIDSKELIIIAGCFIYICTVLAAGADMANMADTIYSMFCCLFVLATLFGLLKKNQLQAELDMEHQLWHKEKEQYAIAKENIELINVKCHDLKHQLPGLLKNECEESIQEIKNALSIYESTVKTGNDALDVILTEKSLLCEKDKIQFTCMVDGEKLKFIEPGDLYSFFGNAIDNAMESVMKLKDERKRIISLCVKSKEKLLSVNIENYYEGDLQFENGLPVTTKEDKQYHGFGMKSIRLFVEKYKGSLFITANKGIFHFSVMLPLQSVSYKNQ